MTSHEAFTEGRLAEAIALQEAALRERPTDASARFTLVELLAFAGRFIEANANFRLMEVDDPAWPDSVRAIRQLFRAERRRSHRIRRPKFLIEPIPRHAKARWLAVKALQTGRIADAVRWVDIAEALSPPFRGFLDGQEFEWLRDADDRFGSVVEAFIQGEYVWLPWESVRRVTLEPAKTLLDKLFRPAEIRLQDDRFFPVHLPLVYPGSHRAEGEFAVGMETDCICPDEGPIRCIGGKLLDTGDVEKPLSECRMIEIRRL